MFTQFLPEYYFAFLVFAVILLYILGTLPIVFECLSLRKDRNKFLDKIHNLKRENRELKRELLDFKNNTQNENTKVGEN